MSGSSDATPATDEARAGGVPTTVMAYAAVVAATYVLRAVAGDGGFPWGQLLLSAAIVAGVWKGWALPWALALLIDLVPVSLAVYLTSFSSLTVMRVGLLVLGVASLVLLLVRPTRRHVFGPLPPRAPDPDAAA